MDLTKYNSNLENWFLKRQPNDFPDNKEYVSDYKSIKKALNSIHKEVTMGADYTDGTSLTWHDESHVKRVIEQASKLISYDNANITAYEVFVLLVAIQIHDVMNIMGRDEHENRAIEIFNSLRIDGLIDSILLKNIGFIASCHSGSVLIDNKKEKDKIFYLSTTIFPGDKRIHLRFLAALLRLADEYADDADRAMSYLLKIDKIKKGSIIHQKHAESLFDVDIQPNTGNINFDYHINVEDAVNKFPKYIKEKDTYEDIYLLDEIFERTVKSHYETIYCMRYLRPYISIDKLHISIEIEHSNLAKQLVIKYELEEKGYPNDELTILGLCGDKYLRKNGGYWSGENLKEYIIENKLSK